MGDTHVLVVLLMEPFALASAVRKSLRFNPQLDVIIAGFDDDRPAESPIPEQFRPTVNVRSKEFPPRFELTVQGSRLVVAYESLRPVMQYLAVYAGNPDVWPVSPPIPPGAINHR